MHVGSVPRLITLSTAHAKMVRHFRRGPNGIQDCLWVAESECNCLYPCTSPCRYQRGATCRTGAAKGNNNSTKGVQRPLRQFTVAHRWKPQAHPLEVCNSWGIDGKSHLVTFMNVSDNNRAGTVREHFIIGAEIWGWPSQVRADHGGENLGVKQVMEEVRGKRGLSCEPE
jgi:hypothetical protein